MKLVELARTAVRILQESGEDGVRSDILAEQLNTPKRRIYDVIAVLKALGQVSTKRRFDGTTITWIDQSRNFVSKSQYDEVVAKFEEADRERIDLQLQLVQLKEQLRITKTKLRRDVKAVEAADRTEFDTTQLRVRALSHSGIRKVSQSGIDVVIESHEPGIVVDPTVVEPDENELLIRNLQQGL
ncbi:MAG: hypothetical protein ACXADC_06035 [Candidatus Thorarchaeota archaeon]